MSSSPARVVPLSEVSRFIIEVMSSAGTSQSSAATLAEVLVAADHRGHYSHGLNRLEYYLNDVRNKMCDPQAAPRVVREAAATALVDGQNGLGPVVGNFCTDLAIQKAKQVGIGWVSANNSNHFGIAGWYTMRCVSAGLIGLSFTNTSPLVVPTRARDNLLGTNPISCAAPGVDGDHFCLDMATCTVALGKIEVQRRRDEPMPEGWASDSTGRVTTDPHRAAGLLPLGGDEAHGGYKGYGLAFMVELFCGLMSGAAYGPHVRRWEKQDERANLGQCFVALDPDCFAPGFAARLQDLMHLCREAAPADHDASDGGVKPVLVAGDPERAHEAQVDSMGGVTYHANQLEVSRQLAHKLNIQPMKTVPAKNQ